jgi:hypothetical protein
VLVELKAEARFGYLTQWVPWGKIRHKVGFCHTLMGLGVAKPDLGLDSRKRRLIGFGKRLGLIGLPMHLYNQFFFVRLVGVFNLGGRSRWGGTSIIPYYLGSHNVN